MTTSKRPNRLPQNTLEQFWTDELKAAVAEERPGIAEKCSGIAEECPGIAKKLKE